MKKLSKIVALLLAGAMAMVMLTACSGGGNTGSMKEDTTAEDKVLGKYSTRTASVDNNKALKAEAEKFLDEKINASGSIFGYKFVLGGEVKGKDKEYQTDRIDVIDAIIDAWTAAMKGELKQNTAETVEEWLTLNESSTK